MKQVNVESYLRESGQSILVFDSVKGTCALRCPGTLENERIVKSHIGKSLDSLIRALEKDNVIFIGIDFLESLKSQDVEAVDEQVNSLENRKRILSLIKEAQTAADEDWRLFRRGEIWHPEEEKVMIKMYHEGAGVAEIAKKLGRGLSGIDCRMQLMGMHDASWNCPSDEYTLIHEIVYGNCNNLTAIAKKMNKAPGRLAKIIVRLIEEKKIIID